jgi:ABC-type dipeptide/oligopeptide/nickel transport system permease component
VPTPRALYAKAQDFFNPEKPVLSAWAYRTYRTNPPYRFVRNPYFFGVDEAGNQLPYVDSILVDIVTPELLAINASTGRLSFQTRLVNFDDYTLMMENQDKYGYDVLHWYQGIRSMWSLFPNINRRPDPNKPMEVFKAGLLKERAFRQALSLAINRQDIIDTLYGSVGYPGQIAPGKGSPFHSPKLEQAYVAYDPDRANALLDGIGLTRRDSEGFRSTPDGDYLVFFIEYENFTGLGPAQFIVEDWAAVGVRAVYRERARAQYYSRKRALKHDFTVYTGESEFNPLVEARSFVPINPEAHFAIEHAMWYTQGGMSGNPNAVAMGGLPPEEGSAVMRAFELYEEVVAAGTLEEQVERLHRIFEINAEEIWSISVMPSPFQPVVVDRGLRNVPDLALFGFFFRSPGNAGTELFFWDDPVVPPGVNDKIKEAMVTVTMPPRVAAIRDEGTGLIGSVIRLLLIGILVASVILAGSRHPYIGRRLALMVPTLAVISVIVFTVIRLPPSNFVETRILELQAQGQSAAALQEVEELKMLFHLEEPVVSQYLRWSGLHWFATFDDNDRGLLQGDLGRSMENTVRVNEIVGDRVILTLTISLGTILFTWALAIPIGIYSAVRQYSVFDYVLTFGGFIGMCIPPFLLALILMYFSTDVLGVDAIGLFSPEYASQPVWTWGKVVDLLKHLWVPILVLGLGGTTGMIRVMRGNLLDELRKPYVTTARAKGVPPLKLLLKYPVRLALNPFVSGIGALFPQLVSGGAIVAVVLGIPTVGPLMLNSLMTEDSYMAGSMLMVLSLLGIFGMLVSDLLLMWLDPRIRMED